MAALFAVAPAAAAQTPACAGVVVAATVRAPSVPDGSWSTLDTCVPPEAVYEANVLGVGLIGGMGVAAYTDGHLGRVAFLSAQIGGDRALTLIGVEDAATGVVTWAYAEGSVERVGAERTMGGAANAATVPAGEAPGPVEPAEVELSITGTGTDLATAQGAVADEIRDLLDQAIEALTG